MAFVSAAVAGHMFTPLGWGPRALLVAVSPMAVGPDARWSLTSGAVLVAFAARNARSARAGSAFGSQTTNQR